MTVKKWISVAIAVVGVVGALLLVKLFPFWVTLACLACLVLGAAAGYIFKDSVEEVIELVEPDTVVDKIKDWFAGLTSNEASKAVAAAKKAKTKE